MGRIIFTPFITPSDTSPPSPETGIAGPLSTDWSATNEAATSGDIVRYQLNDTISFPELPDGFMWTHMRIAHETPTGIVIEQVPFGTSPDIEHRVRCRVNQTSKLWLQFGAEEARILCVASSSPFAVSDVVTGVTSGATATIESIPNSIWMRVSRPSGGVFLPDEQLMVGGVVVGQTLEKHGSRAEFGALVTYSEWSLPKTVLTTTGTPFVLLAKINTTTPLRDEGVRIELKPRGFNTINPRLDLDFQSEILDASEQGQLACLPATLNHPTNRHIGYSEHHTLSFRGTGTRTVRHTIRNFDGSQSASLDTVFDVRDPITEGGWAYVVDVDPTNQFTAGTAGGAQETSFETARLAARAAASALIRIHGTVTASSAAFQNATIQNLRIEGVGANAQLVLTSNLEANNMAKVGLVNFTINGSTNVLDPLDNFRPEVSVKCNNVLNIYATRLTITNASAGFTIGEGTPDHLFLLNDCKILNSANFGMLLGDAPAYLINGLRAEASIDAPRGASARDPGANSNPPSPPWFPPHGGTCRSSRQVGRLGVYQKCLFFTNMSHGGDQTSTRFGSQSNVRVFGDASQETSSFRMFYCTMQSADFNIRSTSTLNWVRSQDVIIDGLHRLCSEDQANLILIEVGGTIVRNSIFTFPNVPQNTGSASMQNCIELRNQTRVGGLAGNLDNQDKVWVYNCTFVVLLNNANAKRSSTSKLIIERFNETAAENNVFHMPNYTVPDALDAPLNADGVFQSIYTGYIPWIHATNTPGARLEQYGHQFSDSALFYPETGSAALEGATTGQVAIRDLTGAFRHTLMTAKSATYADRGAVESPAP